jgi:hypothetical protein
LRQAWEELQAAPGLLREWYPCAVALGRSRLFGVELGDGLDSTLTVSQALRAAGQFARELDDAREDARTLPQTWERLDDPEERLDLACFLLERRMDAWAALVALDEAYEAGLEEHDVAVPALRAALRQLAAALGEFDHALGAQASLLCQVAHTQLLDNWRAWLAPEFAQERPWWLDGRLERLARG